MLIGRRAASIPIQIVAIVLGIVEGMLLNFAVVQVSLLVLPQWLDLPLRFLTIAFCAYFLAAPGTWRGLARRFLLIVAVSFLGYAILGYLIAFLFLRGTPIPGSMPALIVNAQAVIAVVGVGSFVGFLLLRDRKQHEFPGSATAPATESAVVTTFPDPQS